MFGEHRDKRLQRRQEADDFRRTFQPISMLFGAIGFLILAWVGLTMVEGQPLRRDLAGAAATLIAFPLLVFLFRFFRGHFRKDLHR